LEITNQRGESKIVISSAREEEGVWQHPRTMLMLVMRFILDIGGGQAQS